MSQQWDAATTDAAIETANWVANRVWKLAKTRPTNEDATKKVNAFCHSFVTRAFAKRLTEEEQRFFVDQHFEQEISIQDQVKRVVLMTLKSPRFLYPGAQERSKDFELARRMGLTMWDSVPDHRIYGIGNQR